MQRRTPKTCAAALIAMAFLTAGAPAAAQEHLTGNTRLACEALLCLAAANPPSECRPSIRKLFSIWKPSERVRFLRLCPSSSQDQQSDNFAQVTAKAWPTCTAKWLNTNHVYFYGDNGPFVHKTLPQACSEYNAHPWTMERPMPRYVGEPERGGHWVDP